MRVYTKAYPRMFNSTASSGDFFLDETVQS